MADMANISDCPLYAAPGILVVEPYEPSVDSRIELPDSFKQSDQAGTIVAIGEDGLTDFGAVTKCPKDLKIGDHIIHSTYYADAYTHLPNGKRYRFIKFQDYRAKINE